MNIMSDSRRHRLQHSHSQHDNRIRGETYPRWSPPAEHPPDALFSERPLNNLNDRLVARRVHDLMWHLKVSSWMTRIAALKPERASSVRATLSSVLTRLLTTSNGAQIVVATVPCTTRHRQL